MLTCKILSANYQNIMYELISQAIIIDNSIFILMLSVNLSRSVASILFLRLL